MGYQNDYHVIRVDILDQLKACNHICRFHLF